MNQVAEVGAKENKISLVSLDSFLESKSDLIKIDLEGYEMKVIDNNNLKWVGSSARKLIETLEKLMLPHIQR